MPELLHEVGGPRVFSMRQQTQLLWRAYLSSVTAIVHTALEIIFERVHPQLARTSQDWNSGLGALWTDTVHRKVGCQNCLVSSRRTHTLTFFAERSRNDDLAQVRVGSPAGAAGSPGPLQPGGHHARQGRR